MVSEIEALTFIDYPKMLQMQVYSSIIYRFSNMNPHIMNLLIHKKTNYVIYSVSSVIVSKEK